MAFPGKSNIERWEEAMKKRVIAGTEDESVKRELRRMDRDDPDGDWSFTQMVEYLSPFCSREPGNECLAKMFTASAETEPAKEFDEEMVAFSRGGQQPGNQSRDQRSNNRGNSARGGRGQGRGGYNNPATGNERQATNTNVPTGQVAQEKTAPDPSNSWWNALRRQEKELKELKETLQKILERQPRLQQAPGRAFPPRQPLGRGTRQTGGPQDRCYGCGKLGHFRAQCPEGVTHYCEACELEYPVTTPRCYICHSDDAARWINFVRDFAGTALYENGQPNQQENE